MPLLQLSKNSVGHTASGEGGGKVNEFDTNESVELAYRGMVKQVGYDFGLKRRSFMQILGAGLMIFGASPSLAQRSGAICREGSILQQNAANADAPPDP